MTTAVGMLVARAAPSLLVALVLGAGLVRPAVAGQPGELDTGYSGDGVEVVAVDAGGELADRVTAIATGGDSGSSLTYALATVEQADGERGFQLRGFLRDGTLFPVFGSGGVVDWYEPVGAAPDRHSAAALARGLDGALFVLAGVEWSELDFDFLIFKYDDLGASVSDFGSAVATPGRRFVPFDLGGDKRDEPVAIAVDALGVVGAGWVETGAVDVDFGLVRLDATSGDPLGSFGADGERVVAFNRGGSNRDWLAGLALESDGDIVAAGLVEVAADSYQLGLARVKPNGTLDPDFGTAGLAVVSEVGLGMYAGFTPTPVAIDAQGRILIAGAVIVDGSTLGARIWRLSSSGALDPSFGTAGWVTLSETGDMIAPTALALERDGGMMMSSGYVDTATGWRGMLLTNLTAGGAAQPDWIANDAFTFVADDHAWPLALALGWEGEIWLGGDSFEEVTQNSDLGIARLLARRVFADGFESGDDSHWSPLGE